ncbi:NnrS family protein [Aliiroseovarius sp.]|uniref:NnrS family protein n=1 Tax=Aliiroseovarius sp. TaxID=1872442 RepID=UPI003BA89E35
MILLTGAYRLFFPAAGLFAAVALPLWLVMYMGADLLDDPMSWHMHEMLFGYLGAALAGFLFTAIPNWTGRPALAPAQIAVLFGLWLAGRLAIFVAPEAMAAQVITAAFLPVTTVLAGRDIIASQNKRNLVVVGLLAAMSLVQAVFLWLDPQWATDAALALSLVLMALIGGRVTPAFTRNWLNRRGGGKVPPPFGRVDRAGLTATGLVAASWAATGLSMVTGVLAVLATLALAARLTRWQAARVAQEPLLLAQHAAYAWLPIGTALLAAASLSDLVTLSQIRHAFGAGAIGTMTVIVMLRAVLGHSGRPIEGRLIDWILLACLHLGALLRVISGGIGDPIPVLHSAGSLWALGMALFVIRTLPIAMAPRQ